MFSREPKRFIPPNPHVDGAGAAALRAAGGGARFGAEEYQSRTCGDSFRGRPKDILPPTLIHSHTLAIPGRRFGSSARTVSIEIVAVHALRRKVILTTVKRRSKRRSRERTATPVQE